MCEGLQYDMMTRLATCQEFTTTTTTTTTSTTTTTTARSSGGVTERERNSEGRQSQSVSQSAPRTGQAGRALEVLLSLYTAGIILRN